MSKHTRWTPQMRARAIALRHRGLSYGAIGAVLAEDFDLGENLPPHRVQHVVRRFVSWDTGDRGLGITRDVPHNSQFGRELLGRAA